jgi:hypothetical protein
MSEEVVPFSPRKKNAMTALATQVAFLEAQGMSTNEIMKATGMVRTSVSRLRRDPAFQAEVAHVKATYISAIEPLLAKLRVQVLNAHEKAFGVAIEMLEATDSEDRPLWSVRTKGVEIILNSPAIKGLVDASRGGVDGPAVAAAQASVTLIVKRDKEGHETIEYQGEVEEVTDDADRPAPDDSDGGELDGGGDGGDPGDGAPGTDGGDS